MDQVRGDVQKTKRQRVREPPCTRTATGAVPGRSVVSMSFEDERERKVCVRGVRSSMSMCEMVALANRAGKQALRVLQSTSESAEWPKWKGK